MFESEFTTIQHAGKWTPEQAITNIDLRKKLKPRIVAGDREVEFYVAKNPLPNNVTPLYMDDDRSTIIGLKMSQAEAMAIDNGANWSVEINRDLRIPALVSLTKAAYLTLFSMFGYRYALTTAAHFIGRSTLGAFFLSHRNSPRSEVLQAAGTYFRRFSHLVRPVQGASACQGTLSDILVSACWSDSGVLWGTIVYVKTGDLINAVLLPASDHLEALALYLDFLRNDCTRLTTSLARWTPERQEWSLSPSRAEMNWPKE